MKKLSIICIIIALMLSIFPVSAAEVTNDASIQSGSHTLDGQVPILGNQLVDSNMKSAILYEINSDTIMYAYNADEKLPPSSLLKILTALIAIEKGNLSDKVTVKEAVLSTLDADAAKVNLAVGEVVTVKDLIYCMMVASGNDAAVVLADHIMGSQEAFVVEMNRYAESLGCVNTNFTNVHGLHDENQYTTARDIARILEKALDNQEFCEAFGARYYTMGERKLSSQNFLINNDDDINYYDERVTGGRTAVANDRSRSIASVSEVNNMKMLCIVMGAGSKYEEDGYTVKVYGGYNETKKLLDLAYNGYKTAQLLFPAQVVMQKSVIDGTSDVSIGTHNAVYSVIPENLSKEGLTYRYVNETPLSVPVEKGQRVSTLEIWCGNLCLAQCELYTLNGVRSINEVYGEADSKQSVFVIIKYGAITLGVLVCIIFVALITLYVYRVNHIAKMKRHRRRNSMYRRRSK